MLRNAIPTDVVEKVPKRADRFARRPTPPASPLLPQMRRDCCTLQQAFFLPNARRAAPLLREHGLRLLRHWLLSPTHLRGLTKRSQPSLSQEPNGGLRKAADAAKSSANSGASEGPSQRASSDPRQLPPLKPAEPSLNSSSQFPRTHEATAPSRLLWRRRGLAKASSLSISASTSMKPADAARQFMTAREVSPSNRTIVVMAAQVWSSGNSSSMWFSCNQARTSSRSSRVNSINSSASFLVAPPA